ncbi:MAG: carbohydrate kinase [Acidobacteria bacterium]|nr:carbohydrate kinase [Acidobacteriota bacterium]
MPIYLGFDASTQGLTVTAIETDPQRRILFSRTLNYDEALPHYGTRHGVLPQSDPLVAYSPPLMWAEALDRMMAALAAEESLDLSRIAAVSGSAQQHGSVYCTAGAAERLSSLDPARTLPGQLTDVFSRADSPIWMDASTSGQCAAITALVGKDTLQRLSGSRAFERFTGPQIRKFAELNPEAYARTSRIHLVSSFLASLLVAADAPLDPGDASGMNLMDLNTASWDKTLVQATAPDLERRLPLVRPSSTVIGRLSDYWVQRYGFPAANVVVWSGDNPCSLIGAGLIEPGLRGVSLGTSDTVFAYAQEPAIDPSGSGHVFASPTGQFMGLTCFKNGSLARERIRDEYSLDWSGFSHALRTTPPGNRGRVLLPWFEPEITPPVTTAGIRRYGLEPGDGRAHIRGVVEAQVLSMARHTRWMGGPIRRIHATGGAAANPEILHILADVFNAQVYRFEAGNSAALGAALRAFHADTLMRGSPLSWPDVIREFVVPMQSSGIPPNPEHVETYAAVAPIHAACERHALHGSDDPFPLIAAFGTSRA